MAFRIGSPTRPRKEPLDGANEFHQLFHAYETEFSEESNEEAKILAELDSLDTLLASLKVERSIAPRTVQSMVSFFVKKRFGFPRKSVHHDRRLLHHTTLLLMAALTKESAADSDDDADALASLYEFMLDSFALDGSTRWASAEVGPHGSILFAFALFMRQVERTNDALHAATVSRLRSRQADTAGEFEMDDTLSDVVLEKGRSLGGLVLFSAIFTDAVAVESPVFDINDPAWRRLDGSNDAFLHFSPDRRRVWGLQDAGYAFFSRFVDEFGLLDISKSTTELLAVVDVFAALVAHHPSLRASAVREVFRLAEPLSLLFPYQFSPLLRLLAAFTSPDTADFVADHVGLDRPLSTYTHAVHADMLESSATQIDVAADNVVTCKDAMHLPDAVILAGTTGQSVVIDGRTLVCWHVGAVPTPRLSLWDVLFARLKQQPTDSTNDGDVVAALNWLAVYGRVAPRRFDAVWRRVLGTSADEANEAMGLLLAHFFVAGTAAVQAAAVGLLAVLDPVVTAPLVRGTASASMHALVASHDAAGVLACLQTWVHHLHSSPGAVVPQLLQLLEQPAADAVARVAALRLLAQSLALPQVHETIAPTLLFHGRALLFDAATSLLHVDAPTPPATTSKPEAAFNFDRPTPAVLPVLPYSFEDVNDAHVAVVEAALHSVRLLLDTTSSSVDASATGAFVATTRGALNWPVACAAYLTCPASSAIRLAAGRLLTTVALHLTDSSLMACFRTTEDTTAFLTSLIAIVQTNDSSRLQSAVWTLWTHCLRAQPSVLSLLFEIPSAAASLVEALRDTFENGRYGVLASAVGFLLAIWEGLSHSNACHHMAGLFRAQPLFWATLTQPLGVSPARAHAAFAQGAVFKILAIEYHIERQTKLGGASNLDEILASFRELYDQWFHDYTTEATSFPDANDRVPLYVEAADVPAALYVLAQWTTFMEIYFLHPPSGRASGAAPQASPSSRSRITCDSPMLPARTGAPARPSNFSGDRTSLEWSLKLTERMANLIAAAPDQSPHTIRLLSRLCLCMIHHQVCEVKHKTNDPRWSTTQLRPSQQLDPTTSVHLLTLVHSIVHHDTANAALWTASLLLLRQLAPPLPPLLLSRVVTHSIAALAAATTDDSLFSTVGQVLQTVLLHHVPTDSTTATFQLLAIVDQGPLVPLLVSTLHTPGSQQPGTASPARRAAALRCLVALVASDTAVRGTVVSALARLDFMHIATALAAHLTATRPTSKRDEPTQTAWCLLLHVVTALLNNDVATYVAFVANVSPVLQAAMYAARSDTSDNTALLAERLAIVQLVHASSRHMHAWQAVMPGSFSRLLEATRAHLVPCSAWLSQDGLNPDEERLLWAVVHAVFVLLVKLTPSTRPQIQVGDAIHVDWEAARPILDYVSLSAASSGGAAAAAGEAVPCGIGHVLRLVKLALQRRGSPEGTAVPSATADAGLVLASTNYVLHEHRYNHTAARRADMHKGVDEVMALAKSKAPASNLIESLEALVQQVEPVES